MSAVFARLDATGRPVAFYPVIVHPEPPADAVEISLADWRECLANQGRRRFVDGQLVAIDPPGPSAEDVRTEAERRLRAGILVNGSPFKADDASRQRLSEMIAQMRANPGSTITFVTAAGVRFSWSDIATVQSVATAIAGYVVGVLGASAAMQADLPTDLVGDRRWPALPSIEV